MVVSEKTLPEPGKYRGGSLQPTIGLSIVVPNGGVGEGTEGAEGGLMEGATVSTGQTPPPPPPPQRSQKKPKKKKKSITTPRLFDAPVYGNARAGGQEWVCGCGSILIEAGEEGVG